MKRKNITEYAYGYMNSYTLMMTAYQLMSGWLPIEGQDQIDKCHIYIIASRPNPLRQLRTDRTLPRREYYNGQPANIDTDCIFCGLLPDRFRSLQTDHRKGR